MISQRTLCSLLAILFHFSLPAQDRISKADSTATIRIGVAGFAHETCTFCPQPTGITEWEYYGPPLRGAEVLDSNPYIRGFVASARLFTDVEVVGIYAPRHARGGSSGSWITREAFEKYTNGIIEGIKDAEPLQGVFLALHGAMAVTGIPHPEAEIARRIRERIGNRPIVATFDLHGNESEEFLRYADGAFVTKRYPHYDARLQGERAARYLIRIVRGDYVPTTATRKPGVLTPSVYQGTGVSPASEIMERARRWEAREVDAYVSVFFGFAYADVQDVGATVMVMTNDNQKLADRIADDMSGYIWNCRHEFAGRKLPNTEEGVRLAIEAVQDGRTPVIIADHSDRTGNSTHVLKELIRQRATRFCIATISDERLTRILQHTSREGDEVEVTVGGYADSFAGEPIPIRATVEHLGPYGRFDIVAVLLFGEENRIILTPQLHQVTGAAIFRELGLNLDDLDIISLKSRVHFRRGFHETGIAGAIIEIEAPGLGPADLTQVPYQNIPEIYPLAGPDWHPGTRQIERLFAKENLVAWCIVPFDAAKRGPESRAKMLRSLGISKLAYDWREKDIPTFDAELKALSDNGIDLHAFWCPVRTLHPLEEENVRFILDLLSQHQVSPQLWVMLDESLLEDLDGPTRIEKASGAIGELAEEARKIGSSIGLYNHGGWFGEPENQISVIERLNMQNVGIVYNFHHGHEHMERFPSLFSKMKPYLLTVNLNGMRKEGPKILALGAGDREKSMLQVIAHSGYSGPIGILDHQHERDSYEVLKENLKGLKLIVQDLEE